MAKRTGLAGMAQQPQLPTPARNAEHRYTRASGSHRARARHGGTLTNDEGGG
jgi:hypothetical protein